MKARFQTYMKNGANKHVNIKQSSKIIMKKSAVLPKFINVCLFCNYETFHLICAIYI